jgi:hypothetical protein
LENLLAAEKSSSNRVKTVDLSKINMKRVSGKGVIIN